MSHGASWTWIAIPRAWNPTGAWGGGLVYVMGLALAFVWRFRAGAWRRIRI